MLFVTEEYRQALALGPNVIDVGVRLAVPIPADDADSLIEWLSENKPDVEPNSIGWDLRRLFGEWGEQLYYGANCLIGSEPPRPWESFDRERTPDDRLLIDIADDAEFDCGAYAEYEKWHPSAPLIDELERLRDLADANLQRQNDVASEGEILTGDDVKPETDLIQSSASFIANFTPPDYLVDGIFQLGFCYSLTGQTGGGKTAISLRLCAHVAFGIPLGTLHVAKGSVLYLAGENPTDIQMRLLGLMHAIGKDPSEADIHFLSGVLPLSENAERITLEVARKGLKLALIIVDTSAAYFEADDENNNTSAGNHARLLRSLTKLPGGPCVLINAHPTKRAADDELIPRGGGAFLNEMDGNCAARRQDRLVVVTPQGKFRGPEFAPLSFELETVTHPLLKDTRGRSIPTVIAKPLGDAGRTRLEASERHETDLVLRTIDAAPGISLSDIARKLNWALRDGSPNHGKARRALMALAKEKLAEERRGAWRLTQKGQRELNEMDQREKDASAPKPIYPPPNNTLQ